jgi:NYN domain
LIGLPYFDLSNMATFEANYRELLQNLTGQNEPVPQLGRVPEIALKPVQPIRGPGGEANASPLQITENASHDSIAPAPEASQIELRSRPANSAPLVDFENIRFGFRGTGVPERLHESIATALLTIASRFGNIEIAKVYVSSRRWNAAHAAAGAFRELGFELVFDDPRELDGRMVADGISLLSTRADIDTYMLASGDSDFASLAAILFT